MIKDTKIGKITASKDTLCSIASAFAYASDGDIGIFKKFIMVYLIKF